MLVATVLLTWPPLLLYGNVRMHFIELAELMIAEIGIVFAFHILFVWRTAANVFRVTDPAQIIQRKILPVKVNMIYFGQIFRIRYKSDRKQPSDA